MERVKRTNTYIKSIFALLALLAYGHAALAQADHSYLNIKTGNEDRESSSSTYDRSEYVAIGGEHATHHKHFYKFFSIDLGTSNLRYVMPTGKRTTHGPAEAATAQMAYRFNTGKNYRNLFVSAGLELRNLNNVYTFSDARYGVVNDNLHLLYGGVPIMFHYINTKHTSGAKDDVNFYAQAGACFDYKLYMYEHRRDHKKTWDDKESSFNGLLLQPYVSAGISYTVKGNVFLAGPFIAYSANDISSLSTVTGHFTSYGLKVSAMLR